MVRTEGPSEYDRLDALMAEIAEKHGLRLAVTGWTRKTYDVLDSRGKRDRGTLIARVESFATTSGEIVVFDDVVPPFVEELGAALEEHFDIAEAVIVQRPRPA